jgi:hypothetical protein
MWRCRHRAEQARVFKTHARGHGRGRALGDLARRHLVLDVLRAAEDPPGPRAGGHGAGRRGDARGAGGVVRGVEGVVGEVPPVAPRVAEEVLVRAGGERRAG